MANNAQWMNAQMDKCLFFIYVGYALSIQETYEAKFIILTPSSRKVACLDPERQAVVNVEPLADVWQVIFTCIEQYHMFTLLPNFCL